VSTQQIKTIEKISKALGDANRLKILLYLSKCGGSGQCSELQEIIDLAQPSISHHIKILLEAGLIEQEKTGRNHQYSLNKIVLEEYMGFLTRLQLNQG
jgi:ArsR family transcriptional regulator